MIEVIPAIDVIDGKCVRLTRGDFEQKRVYNESPLDVARAFEDAGCRHLHVVDLDGAKNQHIVNYKVLETIASNTELKIDFGGGLKSDDDVRIAFECGAEKITGGSIAVKSPTTFERWLSTYGSRRIILGADTRNGKIATDGWQKDSNESIIPFIEEYVQKGITQIISTDVKCDGTLTGPSIELYSTILDKFPRLYVIASGGVGRLSDIAALENAGIPAVIVGKALYENCITLKDLEKINTTGSCLLNA